ncbi:hypothetical protein B0T13DRAFT_508634 [Neurospora crassa]|nr:hypothetical protein B0T13DRAFT_508634 [Neurospora crassa]
MSTRPQPNNIPPNADLAIPFLDRVLVDSPFPPIAILLTRPFAHYDNDIKLEVTAVTTTKDIHAIKREVERYRFGLSPAYRPDDRVYLVMDMYGFGLPAAGYWRFQIKGYSWIDRKRIEVLSVPQEWLLWMTKTTSRFRYRINPDVALTFQLRAPIQPVSEQPARAGVQPAEPRRPRGRPRKVRVDADPEEHDDMVGVDNNGYMEDIDMDMDEAEDAEGCELSVASFIEQDEDDNVNYIDYYGENPADARFGTGNGADDMNDVHYDDQGNLMLVGDSEDDVVQHQRPQDVTPDSLDREKELAVAGERINAYNLETKFLEAEKYLEVFQTCLSSAFCYPRVVCYHAQGQFSPLRAVDKTQVALSLPHMVVSATENAIKTAGKRKIFNHDSTQVKLFGHKMLGELISGPHSKRERVDDGSVQFPKPSPRLPHLL